ncbi:MAG TPA: tryptophan synthase subunit alpha [Candidatus Blautia avicola]|uniref:Tryptophan synthase alpha chain n=1 Tax=Candidatus Blautia avicola TaxID=2838483 RepID=A0A9D2QSM4_9FIRM|nr:tryptophan synthase subunit alpha [Candidatus Blautia avicola]
MSKISEAFKDTKAFIPFITGGNPSLEITEQLLYAMEEAGADIIEIGIPFSDPIAEGPVIQAANERALAAGCTTDRLFETVKKAREKVQVPMVFLTYLNPIFTYGKERFMERCRECGIQGVIVPDMPFEEKGELREVCAKYGIEIISLIAPTSHERITAIAKEAEGYIYCVSSLGVTGMRKEISTDIQGMVDKVRQVTKVPCAVGFGISTPEQAQQMAAVSDGVIVGSRIVKIVEEYGEKSVPYVREYVENMKKALKKER